MGRAERRRLEKQKGKQVKTYNLTRDQLHNAVRQVTEEDLKRIKQEAMEDAINTAMTLQEVRAEIRQDMRSRSMLTTIIRGLMFYAIQRAEDPLTEVDLTILEIL